MYKVIKHQMLTPNICLQEVEAPRVAASAQPGQFLIVRATEKGERVPLTICDYDREKGTVTIVTQVIGASSKLITSVEEGGYLMDVVGPLGQPSDFTKVPVEELRGKRYVFIAGGLGTAPVYPQAKYLHDAGASVDVILGAKTADLVILEKELSSVSDNLFICTDDGSKGEKGMVTAVLKNLLDLGEHYDCAVAIGPMIMMKFVMLTAKDYNLPLMVSLNTLMVDGTGMCGACRVTVGGKTRFACVEGPEFDAYQVDFDEAMRRQGMYRPHEIEADHKCHIGLH